jgi:hypothetical protein
MDWTPDWNLSSIPENLWKSEHGRRQVAKRKRHGRVKLAACPHCGKMVNARVRRYPCPLHIPPTDNSAARVGAIDAMARLRAAIAGVEKLGPGFWSCRRQGRRAVVLQYSCSARDLRTMAEEYHLTDLTELVWRGLGGQTILETADLEGAYENFQIECPENGEMEFFAVIPVRE